MKLNGAEQAREALMTEVEFQAPLDLAALGIDSPHSRWGNAKAYITMATAKARKEVYAAFNEVAILIDAVRNAEKRGETFAARLEDLLEVKQAMGNDERWQAYEKTLGREMRTALKLGRHLDQKTLYDLYSGKLEVPGERWKFEDPSDKTREGLDAKS